MTCKIKIEIGGRSLKPATELGAALRDIADQIEHGVLPEQIRIQDDNVNCCGTFEIT